ncbi:dephospho-CoA kinase [Thioalkalivibrio sp.]|uniref:dephospho-CoA kinase n=1 Tax=Thioalkalivibrio sp. TaxID=2093813 RepID=UPI0035697051
MLRIGLTGGIGSGKSTVSAIFQQLGAPVIDTDRIAREVVAPGEPALAEIGRSFGSGLLRPDGSLDRAALRRRVFRDPSRRRRLEAITHPAIDARMRQRLAELPEQTPYVLLVIPLLLEAGWQDRVDRILLVDCPEAVQVQRVVARDGIDPQEAWRMIRSQASRDARRQAADDVIENDGRLDQTELTAQVRGLDRRYREAAGSGTV